MLLLRNLRRLPRLSHPRPLIYNMGRGRLVCTAASSAAGPELMLSMCYLTLPSNNHLPICSLKRLSCPFQTKTCICKYRSILKTNKQHKTVQAQCFHDPMTLGLSGQESGAGETSKLPGPRPMGRTSICYQPIVPCKMQT